MGGLRILHCTQKFQLQFEEAPRRLIRRLGACQQEMERNWRRIGRDRTGGMLVGYLVESRNLVIA